MRAIALFALATAFLIGVLGWVLALVFTASGDARALWISAVVAFVVQLFGFALARMSAKSNVIAGWGVGMLLRLLTLGVYALLVVPALALPSGTALIALVAFFFVSTLVEPLFLTL